MKDVPPPREGTQGSSSATGLDRESGSSVPAGAAKPRKAVGRPVIDDERLRAILRGSARQTATPSLLSGVQQRIHERSRGRFYADGWSRSRAATSTYVVTSLLALGIFLLAYFVLLPALPVK
jgi:hypothetical protein